MSKTESKNGLVHVYTGDGKGKTTAALGLAFRACGHGFAVHVIQFMKGDINYGELKAAKSIPNLTIVQFGRASFVDKENPALEDIELAKEGFEHAKAIIQKGEHDIIILDELNVAVDFKLVSIEDVLNLIDTKPENMEIIITGRGAHKKLIERADYVTDMRNIKHPYDRGLMARDGIEH